jgi:hypothetical protein
MSRAFVNEDSGGVPEPRYDLPDPESAYFAEAAAWALLQGADQGDTPGAELATEIRWGDERLESAVREILERAEGEGQDRVAQLARRYLRATGKNR